jgi:hypothetical protein
MTHVSRLAPVLAVLSLVACSKPPAAQQAAVDAYKRAQAEVDRYSERAGRSVAALQSVPDGDEAERQKLIADLRAETIQTVVTRDSVMPYLTIEQKQVLGSRERAQFEAALTKASAAAGRPVDIDRTYREMAHIAPLLNPLAETSSSLPQVRSDLVAPPPPQNIPRHSPIPPVDRERPLPAVPRQSEPPIYPPLPLPTSTGPTFQNVPYILGGRREDPAPDHQEIQCGIFGPAHSQATCDSTVSHAECSCEPNAAVWGRAVCGCKPGPPAGTPELASPDRQCVLQPQEVYCPNANVRYVRYPAFPWSSNCLKGWHGWCQPTVCNGNRLTLGNVGCTPDGR